MAEQSPSKKSEGGQSAASTQAEGVTTRDDALDLGVPMLPGAPSEPQGPEDALGEGPKRGDYTDRQPENTRHYEAVVVPDAGEGEPTTRLVEQNPRVEDIGEAEGLKGGVDTAA